MDPLRPQNQNKPHFPTVHFGKGRLPKRPPFIAPCFLSDHSSRPYNEENPCSPTLNTWAPKATCSNS